MKLILLAILIATATAAPSCKAANYCLGCHLTTADTCIACFNSGLGSLGARYLSANVCTTKVTAITNCSYYDSGLTVAAAATNAGCQQCNSGYYVIDTAGTITCSKTLTTGCTAVTNCAQTKCTGTTATCMQCSSTFGAATAGSCTTGANMTNCAANYWSTANRCYVASTGFAVSSGSAGVTAYTTDASCRMLHAGNASCSHCKDGYYWNVTVCKAAAGILSAAFTMIAAFWM